MNARAHPFSLRQLQYAVIVAEELSFGRAAERCGVSQPSLSAQIAQLETTLGIRLFERSRRKVLVTNAGSELLRHARQILMAADDLSTTAQRRSNPLSGRIRIGVIPTISPYLLPVIAPVLRRTFSDLQVIWHEDKTNVLVAMLQNGRLDGALVALEAELGDVVRTPIANDPFVLAFCRGWRPPDADALIELAELRGVSVLLLDEGHCFRTQTLELCTTASARELAFRATSLATLVQMVAGGAGVTLLPELAIATELRGTDLQLRRFAEPTPKRTIGMIWRKGSPIGAALTKMSREIRMVYPM